MNTSVTDFLSNPAVVAFVTLLVLALSVYSGYKMRNKGQDFWAISLFNIVLQFVLAPFTLILGSYFTMATMGTGVLNYQISLVISSVVIGFYYFIKLAKFVI